MKKARYYEEVARHKHAEITCADCVEVIAHPVRREVQADGRIRLWGRQRGTGRFIRVILLADGETLHNAFLDRDFEAPTGDAEEQA